jgi:hypothetical protein
MEVHRADSFEFWGTWIVVVLWLVTTALVAYGWVMLVIEPPWDQWIGFSLLAVGAVILQVLHKGRHAIFSMKTKIGR